MIPCRYIPYQNYSSPYLMIFFHGNSEDIGYHLSDILLQFGERFSMDILCPEYPTYGMYNKKDDSLTLDEAIIHDARTVIKYCHEKLRYKYENIILVGRSLGTGVAVRMATEFNVRGTVLISPYTCVRDVAKHMVGNMLAKFVPDVFRSIDYISKVKSPVLFIHGEDDTLIPLDMSVKLHAKTRTPKTLKVNRFMSHNQFRIESDMLTPIHMFMIGHLDLRTHLFPPVPRTLRDKMRLETRGSSAKKSVTSSKQGETEATTSQEGQDLLL